MEKTLITRQDQSTGLNKRDKVQVQDMHILSSWVSKYQPKIGPDPLLAPALQPAVVPNLQKQKKNQPLTILIRTTITPQNKRDKVTSIPPTWTAPSKGGPND